ncbi:MAG: alanine racemase [Bellilinea sp.]|jgi:alanine racemase
MVDQGHTTWLEIDLGAIQNNYRELRRISQTRIVAVVKANAYGHGLAPVAQAVSRAGGEWLAVAREEEAVQLRLNQVFNPTLVMGYTVPEKAAEAARDDIRLAVFDRETAEKYSHEVSRHGLNLKVHVKVNTGMNRLGISPEETVEFVRWLKFQKGIEVEGIFTHFARADERAQDTTPRQIQLFNQVLTSLAASNNKPELVHASNSSAVFNFPAAHYDMARCGIALYGLHPSNETLLPDSFRPALTLKTRLTATRLLPPGTGVGYNFRYFTSEFEQIGTLAVGYADGFRRVFGNIALIRGQQTCQVGSVCMDQMMVSLKNAPEAKLGDIAVLIGRQGDQVRTTEDVAKTWNTVNYEVVCGMAERLPRYYYDSEPPNEMM